MPQDPKDVETAKKIAPAVHAFTQAMADAGLVTSALIFDEEGSFLIRAGNAEHRGAEFVRLHYYLSLVIAQLEAMGEGRDMSVVEPASGGTSQDSGEIALRMATACIQVPPELIPDRIRMLAEEYLTSVGT
jgi:hypothetical protein